jgi:hypothetical protein
MFEEFNVLADAKNFETTKIPNKDRDKIKNDLLNNEHMTFGWIISLNTKIDKWDKATIMYEWINSSQCIVYINELYSFDPKKLLRMVWFICKEINNLIKDGKEDMNELVGLKNKQFKMFDKIKEIRKNIRELNTSMNFSKKIVLNMDDQLMQLLEMETNNISVNISLLDEWWEKNIEYDENETILSTDLWTRFKQENKKVIGEMEITVDKFKNYLKTKVACNSIVIKNKNANSAFEVKGIKIMNKMMIETEKK